MLQSIPMQRVPGPIGCLLFLLPLMLLSSCGESSGRKQADGAAPVLAEGYLVQPEAHVVSIRATGDLLPMEEVEIKAPVAGNVRTIHFREGQQVNKGALLVEIDNRSWVAQKKGLEARLISAESELGRKEKMLTIQGVSEEAVEQTVAEVSSLKAQIEGLDVMIDLAAVRAPFSGRLGMRNFSPGAWLSQGSIIARLVQSDQVRVHFTIPAKYAAMAGINQEVKLVSSRGGDTATAVVYAIDPRITASSRSLQLRAVMKRAHPAFIPGDFVQVSLEVEKRENALMVPAECIVPELRQHTVFVVRNGKAIRTVVKTGSRTEDRVEIVHGLAPGDTVLTTGHMEVRDGGPVTVLKLHSPVSE
jgi:membrane fusion protein, multidrug efflux system